MEKEQVPVKGLDNVTVCLMIGTAVFFDALQLLLDFIFMGWLVTIFAWLTFIVWFIIKGISLWTIKRVSILGIGTIVDLIPFLGAFAWTAMIITLALDSKIKKVLPGSIQKAIAPTSTLKKAA
jgi:hypothetical protein